jgi:hypothetical protein
MHTYSTISRADPMTMSMTTSGEVYRASSTTTSTTDLNEKSNFHDNFNNRFHDIFNNNSMET